MAFVTNVLSNQSIIINNVAVTFVPNTLSMVLGRGTNSVKGVAIGGGNSGIALSENIEERIGCIKFEKYSEEDILDFINIWKDVDPRVGNVIHLVDNNFTGTMTSAFLITDPEVNFKTDGTAEFEFKGDPIQ